MRNRKLLFAAIAFLLVFLAIAYYLYSQPICFTYTHERTGQAQPDLLQYCFVIQRSCHNLSVVHASDELASSYYNLTNTC